MLEFVFWCFLAAYTWCLVCSFNCGAQAVRHDDPWTPEGEEWFGGRKDLPDQHRSDPFRHQECDLEELD